MWEENVSTFVFSFCGSAVVARRQFLFLLLLLSLFCRTSVLRSCFFLWFYDFCVPPPKEKPPLTTGKSPSKNSCQGKSWTLIVLDPWCVCVCFSRLIRGAGKEWKPKINRVRLFHTHTKSWTKRLFLSLSSHSLSIYVCCVSVCDCFFLCMFDCMCISIVPLYILLFFRCGDEL